MLMNYLLDEEFDFLRYSDIDSLKSPGRRCKSTRMTVAPCSTKAVAIAAPIPDDAPVTLATVCASLYVGDMVVVIFRKLSAKTSGR
jgi:hypothetical protein